MPDRSEALAKQTRLSIRLMLGVGLLVLLVLSVTGLIAYRSVEDEVREVYDSQLVNSATILWSLTRENNAQGVMKMDDDAMPLDRHDRHTLMEYGKWRSFRVWHDGQLIRTTNWEPLAGSAPGPQGFTNIQVKDIRWRIYTLYVPQDQMVIEVGEMDDARLDIISQLLLGQFLPLLAGIPFIMLAIWLGIRWGLKDLRLFANTVRARSDTDLSSIETRRTPVEILPLANALNSLLSNLGRSLEQERRFTDNAAHELRTPLATLGVQADVIMNARTAAERKSAITELTKGVTRASRLLDQLLTLARIRHAPMANTRFNLYNHVRDAIRDIYPKALQKNITLSLSGMELAVIESKPAPLGILLNNLLDNAIKYSPAGTGIEVTVERQGIIICDQGPGIADAEQALVFTRFYRAKGVNETGSGLGLSIVRDIADILPAEITLSNQDSGVGLRVEVVFPSTSGNTATS
jgi:signal transduction histidine kinase